MKLMIKGWKHYVLFIFLTVGMIFLASYAISYYYDFVLSSVSFTIGLIVLLLGIYLSMEGRSFGNRMAVPGNSMDFTNVALELERENQEIQRQGSYAYAVNNRMIKFRSVPFAMFVSGLISFGITYFIQ